MERKLSKLKDRMLEVELFVGEQLQDLTNEQVVQAVDKKYGSYWISYYTDPKVTHPSTKIDVPIPKEWESSSYTHDVCPSFTHKVLQIFVMDEQSRIDEGFPHKYSVMLQDDYGCGYDSLLESNDWFEVIDFVNNYGEKTNADK